MADFDPFERSLADALRSDADLSVARFEPGTIAQAAMAGTQPRSMRIPWRPSVGRTSNRWSVAAAAVIAVIVVGGAFFMLQRRQPAVIAVPTPTPSAEPSPSLRGVVPPSSTPDASEPAAPSAGPTSSVVPSREGVWIDTGPMGTPRYGHTAVRLLDGRVLVVGGGGEHETDPDSAELYDPISGTWSATGNMLKPHDGFGATLLRDGKVLIGDVDDPSLDDRDDWITGAEVYDPASGTWSLTGKTVVHDPGSATLLRDGTVLVSGEDGSQLYDPDSGTWTATGAMAHTAVWRGRTHPAARRQGARGRRPRAPRKRTGLGRTLRSGHRDLDEDRDHARPTGRGQAHPAAEWQGARDGWDPSRRAPDAPELYDPATGTWTVTGDYARPDAHYQSPTLLSDGTVLVVSPELIAEVYDPGTGAWTVTGTMLRPHNGVPATLLLDGTVLVAGGSECREGRVPSSAELYVPAGVSPPTTLAPVPSPTPIPTPSPSPSPVPPRAGPVPPGGWPWTVRVVNRSSSPATLFVADETQQGLLGRLVGRATPNVVAPGATVKVTFLLPAKGVDGWSIFVNPGPDKGNLVGSNDVPLKGEIVITADGQVGWLSP